MTLQCPLCTSLDVTYDMLSVDTNGAAEVNQLGQELSEHEHRLHCQSCAAICIRHYGSERDFLLDCAYSVPPRGEEHRDYEFN